MNPPAISLPPAPPDVRTTKLVKLQLHSQVQEESQVILHCAFSTVGGHELIRVQPTTYLFAAESRRRSRLLHCERISIAPHWTHVENGATLRFTLFFAGLPKGCRSFDLKEFSTDMEPFFVRNIRRNTSDIYHIRLT